MNIYRVAEDLAFLAQVGITLETGERMRLELALLKLTELEHVDEVLFWGRVDGVQKNYYVAVALWYQGVYEFPRKKFYWSGPNFVFQELGEVAADYAEQVRKFKGYFYGEPAKVLIDIPKEQGGEEKTAQQASKPGADEDSDDEAKKVKKVVKPFTELDRLAFVVRAIENDCQLVPVGSLRMTTKHELRRNDNFEGLSKEQAYSLENYMHFRAAQETVTRNQLGRADSIFRFNLLDPMSNDEPKGCWSIHADILEQEFTVRSLAWPGYIGYNRAGSPHYGGVYIGDGLKNLDLCFMLS